jgi:uncharacterized protein with beta-barrel porin domain
VRAEVRGSWQHEFGDTSTQITSRFSSLGGNAFTVTGPVTGRDSLLLGAGFTVLLNESTAIYVYHDGEVGRSNYDSHSISGGFRLQFQSTPARHGTRKSRSTGKAAESILRLHRRF